jgi:hypothetical protein
MAYLDRYLDSDAMIKGLRAGEVAHHLDEQAVLDRLREAAKHCGIKGGEAQQLADAYFLARGAYFAEIKRRVEARGESLKTWHARTGGTAGVGVSLTTAQRAASIGNSADPAKALQAFRAYDNDRKKEFNRSTSVIRQANELARRRDPLTPIKHEWRKLSPRQQDEFFRWTTKMQLSRATSRDPK